MKYEWITQHRQQYPLDAMCRVFMVNRGSYLNSFKRPQSQRSADNFKLLLEIKAAHQRGRGIHGAFKIQTDLAE